MLKVLAGMRVLDFGRYVAGPYCAALLADLGAETIRIEKRGGSEDRYVVPVTENGEGAQFLQMNRNKLSIELDPLHPMGREIVKRLVASADIVVANLPASTLASMGLDYASLTTIRPDIILADISAFGDAGPLREQVGFDSIGQAMSGSAYAAGDPEMPRRTQAPWVDFGTAVHAAFGVMAAVVHRMKGGGGQHIQCNLLATALCINNTALIEEMALSLARPPSGNRSPYYGPSDIFRTKDGAIMCSVLGQPLFKRWARLVGDEGLLSDPRFKDDEARGAHGDTLSRRMAEWCATRTQSEALEELSRARIPAGPVLSPQQVLGHPHVQAMRLLQDVDYPGLAAPAPVAASPVTMNSVPSSFARRPPLLGEHTEAVLSGVGYSDGEIEEFRNAKAI